MSTSDCPLCMEKLDSDDERFFPCICRYQICRFCWSKIVNELNGECPQCRQKYDLSRVHFREPSHADERKQPPRQAKRRKDISTVKHLTKEQVEALQDHRVVQKNLIYASGLPQEEDRGREITKLVDYFSMFGRVVKVEVNNKSTFQDSNGNSTVCAYITFERSEDAMRAAICEQVKYENRSVRLTFGTTKYCSQFLKGSKCTKPDCMYLHVLGDPEASFTKAEMDQGKHRAYMESIQDKFVEEHPTIMNELVEFISPSRLLKRRSQIHQEPSSISQKEELPLPSVPSTSSAPTDDNNMSNAPNPTSTVDNTATTSSVSRITKPSKSPTERRSVRSNVQQSSTRPPPNVSSNSEFRSNGAISTHESVVVQDYLNANPVSTLPSRPTIFSDPTQPTVSTTQIRSQYTDIPSYSNAPNYYCGLGPSRFSGRHFGSPVESAAPGALHFSPTIPRSYPSAQTQTSFDHYSVPPPPPPPGFEDAPMQTFGYPQHLIDNAMKNRVDTELPLNFALLLAAATQKSFHQARHEQDMAELNEIRERVRRERMMDQQRLNDLSYILKYAMDIEGNPGESTNPSQPSVQQSGPSSSRAATLNRGGYHQ